MLVVAADRDSEAATVEWGVLTEGDGRVQTYPSEAFARRVARGDDRGLARVVRRTVRTGPWQAATSGNEWAMRVIWADGYSEVHPQPSRSTAERRVRGYGGEGHPEVVSRQVTRDDWSEAN